MDERECGTLEGMRPPIFVRTLTDDERQALEQGLRSESTPSSCAAARSCWPAPAASVPPASRRTWVSTTRRCSTRCTPSTPSDWPACRRSPRRAHRTRLVFSPEQAERLRALLQRSPRDFGKPDSLWTLEWAAEVSVAEGIVPTRVSGETIRQTVLRLGLSWKRAKHWITSPDPGYARKRAARPPDCCGEPAPRLGAGLCR